MMKIDQLVDQCSSGLSDSGRFRMLGAYRSVAHSLRDFCGDDIPPLRTVFTKDFLRRYQEYLYMQQCMRNTISFYMTVLRSLYQGALAAGKVRAVNGLFADVFTGSDPTVKRALDSESIAAIHSADLSAVPRLERCRDLFMLSFHLQGMPFVDLAHLRKVELDGDMITYRRQKTTGVIRVVINEAARSILDKYLPASTDSPYVLPLLTLSGEAGYTEYQSVLRRQNRQLKGLAARLGLATTLSSYVARHSWATLAHHSGVDVAVVSQAMGHRTEEMTHNYLAGFASQRLADANQVVLDAILRPIREGRIEAIKVLPVVRRRTRSLNPDINKNDSVKPVNIQVDNQCKGLQGGSRKKGDRSV